MSDVNAGAAVQGGRAHCPVCQWEIDPSAAQCPFCGADFQEIWQRHGRAHMVAKTAVAVLKLGYVPAVYWGITADFYYSWVRVLPLYSKDPRLALAHWEGAVPLWRAGSMANAWLFLFVFALGWIIAFWPDDVNPAGSVVNGFCTWALYFPMPMVVLMIVRPEVAARLGQMAWVTIRYLLL